MLTTLDFAVIAVYLVGVAAFGIVAAGRQTGTRDYFLGGRNLPWWAVSFSVVATETSTLTVIGIPAVSYLGTLSFFQITLGYLLGRTVVAFLFLPRYFAGDLSTAYGFLGARFGSGMRATASVTFMLTRLLADGVRLFASAIPIKVIADSAGWETSYLQIIAVLGIVTIIYTYVGGIRAVVWMDVVQMAIYLGGAVLAVFLLIRGVPSDWFQTAVESGKTNWIDFGLGQSLSMWATQPYTFVTAVVGGAVFSMASHGTDQLIVQRLLACRNVRDGQRALILSALVVMFQFALFLIVGLLLWVHYGQATLDALGLGRGDEVFPKFIIEGMPAGISGLVLAGIFAAAMSTLSSSLNSLASSSVFDLYRVFRPGGGSDKSLLRISRMLTLGWGIVFIVFANLFTNQQNPVVELGLAIASFTYGGLLGVFLLAVLKRGGRRTSVISFVVTLAAMVVIIFGVWYSTTLDQWLFDFYPSADLRAELGLRGIGWPWYTAIGAGIMLCLGTILGKGAEVLEATSNS